MRERPCSEGDAGLCDGSERDMEVCNDQPCYDWTVKARISIIILKFTKSDLLLYSFAKFADRAYQHL